MKIVGFAQTMRLGSAAEEGYVLTVQLDNGTETSIPTSQDTVLAITKLWAANRAGYKDPPRAVRHEVILPEPEVPPPPSARLSEEDDEGEVFGGDVPEVNRVVEVDDMGYPVARESMPVPTLPRPRFLESEDDDGNQV